MAPRPLAVLTAVAILLAGLHAAAAGEGEELYGWSSVGAQWHWVDVSLAEPGVVTFEGYVQPRSAHTVAAGLWVLDAQGEVLRRETAAAWSRSALQVQAAALGVPLADVVQGGGPDALGLRVDVALGAGTHRVVALFGGDAPDVTGRLSVFSRESPAFGARATGNEVLFAREHDLDATMKASLSVPAEGVDPAEVRVVNQGSTSLTAEGSVFGAFAGSANLLLDMALVTPEGIEDGQTFYPLDNAGGGAFQFLLRAFADAAPPGCDLLGCQRSGVWLLVADVAL